MSECNGSWAVSHIKLAFKRWMIDGSGLQSFGTTLSHFLLWTPPRPAMLLWPDNMKICFLVVAEVGVGWSDFWVELMIPILEFTDFWVGLKGFWDWEL